MDKYSIRFSGILVAVSVLASWPASAADVYTRPQVDLRVEHNDNFNLSPVSDSDSDVYGYIAELEALIGIATPRSDTSLRPRVRLQEFPDREDFERVEGTFDVASRLRGQRSDFRINARYSRRDVYNTETPSGDFDPLDPDGGGDNPEAGEIIVGETRTEVEFRPSFDYRITERTRIGIGANLRTARYDADGGSTRIDYDYGVLSGDVTWAVSPVSDFTLGGYASRYEATDDSRETDAIGALIGYAYRWNERTGIEVTAYHEENDTTQFVPETVEDSSSNFGGELSAYRRAEVSGWRLSIGRTFVPTGDRGKSQFDQLRLEYDRQLSPRLGFRGVGRFDSRSGLASEIGGSDDRDYARVDLTLRWFATPTWYVGGGYSYIWVDRELAISDAHNNKFFINFGYRGLTRQ